jgi:hypothetical protein
MNPAPESPAASPLDGGTIARTYAGPTAVLTAVVVWIAMTVSRGKTPTSPEALIHPMAALFAVTVLVGIVMMLARNGAVIRGLATIEYYAKYRSADAPDDGIERPARTFNNLMQVPTLFYVVCILMIVTKRADEAQVQLAWAYVALRAAHAAFYMLVNAVPYRFVIWLTSSVTLCVIWYRFAAGAS